MENINRICNPAYVHTMKQLANNQFVSKHSTLMDLRTTQLWYDKEYADKGITEALIDWRNDK